MQRIMVALSQNMLQEWSNPVRPSRRTRHSIVYHCSTYLQWAPAQPYSVYKVYTRPTVDLRSLVERFGYKVWPYLITFSHLFAHTYMPTTPKFTAHALNLASTHHCWNLAAECAPSQNGCGNRRAQQWQDGLRNSPLAVVSIDSEPDLQMLFDTNVGSLPLLPFSVTFHYLTMRFCECICKLLLY